MHIGATAEAFDDTREHGFELVGELGLVAMSRLASPVDLHPIVQLVIVEILVVLLERAVLIRPAFATAVDERVELF